MKPPVVAELADQLNTSPKDLENIWFASPNWEWCAGGQVFTPGVVLRLRRLPSNLATTRERLVSVRLIFVTVLMLVGTSPSKFSNSLTARPHVAVSDTRVLKSVSDGRRCPLNLDRPRYGFSAALDRILPFSRPPMLGRHTYQIRVGEILQSQNLAGGMHG